MVKRTPLLQEEREEDELKIEVASDQEAEDADELPALEDFEAL